MHLFDQVPTPIFKLRFWRIVRARLVVALLSLALMFAACSDPAPLVDLSAQEDGAVGTIPTADPDTPDDVESAEPSPTAADPSPTAPETSDDAGSSDSTTSDQVSEDGDGDADTTTTDPTPASPTPASAESDGIDDTVGTGDEPASTPTTAPTVAAAVTPVPTAIPVPQPARPEDVALTLTPIVSLNPLTAMVSRPGSDAVYVAEKTGRVLEVSIEGASGTVTSEVLNLQGRVSAGNEQGLLGLAFSPDGQTLFVNFTDLSGTTQVTRYPMVGNVADQNSETTIFSVGQPAANHNGGDLAFGPDGLLYVALGDGGAANDAFGHGQNIDTTLATVLRLNPDGTAPADNPFVGVDGDDRIWLYGARNPWRISFDADTGDLWVADVGQNALEEVSVLYRSAGAGRGANLGWPFVEGTQPFAQSGPPAGGNYVGPIFQYGRANGCSVTGGYVYRGSIAALDGVYVFADFCTSQVWGIVSSEAGGFDRFVNFGLSTGASTIAAFGQGPDNALYVVSLAGTLYRLDQIG